MKINKIITIITIILMIIGCLGATGNKSKIEANKTIENETTDENEANNILSLPESFDWRDADLDDNRHGISNGGKNFMTSVKDQRGCGACWAFATIGAVEADFKIEYEDPEYFIDLSEQYMVSCADWGHGCFGCSGSILFDLADNFISWTVQNEAIPEDCFPWGSSDGDPPSCNEKCPDWENQKRHVKSYYWCQGFDRGYIKARLIKTGPLIAKMKVYEDFRDDYANKAIWPDDIYYHNHGGYIAPHVVVIVGYNENQGYWICKNSWGAGFGFDNGYFKIKYGECNIEEMVAEIDVVYDGPPRPNLDADDDLIWTDVTPGSTVQSSFNVENVGEAGSYLDWKIKSYPSWGEWTFKPQSGTDLTPEEGEVEITAEVIVPFEGNTEFTGYVKVVNKNKETDYRKIQVSLATEELIDANLTCRGGLTWQQVKPGSAITDSFTVSNNGGPCSKLDWEISSYPDWGEWTFKPKSGTDLTPEEGEITVQVTVTAPNEKMKAFQGLVKVINKNNEDDFHCIYTHLTTPKSKFLQNYFLLSLSEKIFLIKDLINWFF